MSLNALQKQAILKDIVAQASIALGWLQQALRALRSCARSAHNRAFVPENRRLR